MAVTIRDVAREAGVSVATVSHALTGYTDISVKTRQKIQETAREQKPCSFISMILRLL